MKVAINGAGIAGPTLAYWLQRCGHEPHLFEKASALRTGGYLLDFWGLGYQVAERMGLIPELGRVALEMKRLSFRDLRGREVCGFDFSRVREKLDGRFFTLARGDLAQAIFTACGDVPVRFGAGIDRLDDAGDAVQVTLTDGTVDTFDVVVGADGLHSQVRRQVFAPDEEVESFLGCYVAAFRLPDYPHRDETTVLAHTTPKRWAARITRNDGATMVLFIFRSSLVNRRPESGEEKAVLRRVFRGMQWEVPEILEGMEDAEEVYFDRVSQIHLPSWTKGRVALVGDSAACASLLAGEGSGLAMTEAYVLAGEIHRCGPDVARAFAAYNDRLRDFVRREQQAALRFRPFFVPKTAGGQFLRDLTVRLASLPGLSDLVAGRTVPGFSFPDYKLPAVTGDG